ncbi:pyridoxal phosphate-dependent aminotransferase [Notoacmeibacter sp. MSK16QG-6]|uniref:pyridoxal phosphate-dependent aminotransferase n=1 Tax=Notoacmeibacter sp. MSK16QG-6 TaxID=2957982 RepID=UPI00209D4CA9|nr:pyridoxal phosphate-dependent aminotransferase [Notoacmeibacter sp. MSK16QG-6]MCP1200020.1 pyridoxal phosphate-dependent aminotransferase [Notoacmeibacter sp. MSK16QG-6]
MDILSAKLSAVKPSQTKAMTALAAELKAQGKSIITLSQGEPDFATPEHISQAAIAAIHAGHTKYTAVAGIPALREAVVEKFRRDNSLNFTPEQITVGCGAKQLLFNALVASLDEGDEVVFPTPCWVSYPEIIKLAGGVPIAVETRVDNGFIMQPSDLRAAITPRTKWLMLNSPSNPTGAVYSRENLEGVAAVLRDFPRVWVLADDIYEHLIYGDAEFCTMAEVAPDLASRTLTVNGTSKSCAMTGWRVGYAGGPLELIKAMNTVQGQSTSHTSSISQHAAVEALNGDQGFIKEFRDAFEKRRDLVVELVNEIPGLSCDTPNGAFYVFIGCQEIIGRKTPAGKTIKTDMDFAMYLMEEAGVAVVPGSGFLADGFIRISYASSEDDLKNACTAIGAAVSKLTRAQGAA